MIRVAVTTYGVPSVNQREQFKQYVSVPDNSRDALLDSCLTRAMLAVQAAADVAILPCSLRMTIDRVARKESFRLYQGGAVIQSVSSEKGPYYTYLYDGCKIQCAEAAERLTVNYTNEVIESEAEKLMPVVWQYGTALYDGETPEVLANILKQIFF